MKRVLVAILVVGLCSGLGFAKDKPSSSGSSFSKPSSGSKPSGGSGFSKPSSSGNSFSKPSSGGNSFSKPSSSGNSFSKPSSGGNSFSKPSTPTEHKPEKVSGGSGKPSTSSTSVDKPADRPTAPEHKTSGGGGFSKPSTPVEHKSESKPEHVASPSPPPVVGSKPGGSRPSVSFDAAAGEKKKREESKIAYEKAQAQKSPKYTTPSGQTVEVHKDSHTTQTARSIPVERVKEHKVIVEKHYHTYYGPRYDYYRNQPYVYVGCGYSPLFWYAMADWTLERQAMWYYHHEQQFLNGELNRDLYNERMQNSQLRAEVERLKARAARGEVPPPNAAYVDSEFKDHPEAMLDTEFVKAAQAEEPTTPSASWSVLGWILAIIAFIFAVWLLFFGLNWGRHSD